MKLNLARKESKAFQSAYRGVGDGGEQLVRRGMDLPAAIATLRPDNGTWPAASAPQIPDSALFRHLASSHLEQVRSCRLKPPC